MQRPHLAATGRVLAAALLAGGLGCKTASLPLAAADGGSSPAAPSFAAVTALGRLEPKDGLLRVAGPSRMSVVIARLLVDEGDWVEAGQTIAVLDTLAEDEARVARLKAELGNAQADLARWGELFRQGTVATTSRDAAQLKVDVAKAEIQAAHAALDLDTVRAPLSGQVVKIHARRGEKVGPEGIAEIGRNDQMYAVAEVYETDIGRVKLGQRATVRSPALDPELTGTVERIGLKVGRLQALDTDPATRTDARVVEVQVRLDDSKRAASLTYLQVEIAIQPG
jgi:multidrug efflux pump subunit AcrA (membrane-fusion protein)